ncbi:MAG: ZIP family metal transporter [Lautropia sp.]
MTTSGAWHALGWGSLSGGALLVGAAIGYWSSLSARVVAGVMSFGSGVLIAALSVELMDEAFARGGLVASSAGFLGGAVVFTLANLALAHFGGRHRKRSGDQQASSHRRSANAGAAIAIGALVDGVPESVAIGVSLLAGAGVSIVTVAAVFLSNLPEGLSSAAGMRRAGKSPAYVFGVWGGIALASGLASLAGYLVFGGFPPEVIAIAYATAAGAILAMLADTMIPEAFEHAHDYAGLITVAGFLVAYALGKGAAA